MQQAFSFSNRGETIAGTLHLPSRSRRCPAVAMFHGFTGQRCEANFIYVELSRRLEKAGIASLRIDFRGSGESDGRFQDMTPLSELSDAVTALAQLAKIRRVDPKRLGVLGISLGGLVAAMAAGDCPRVKSAVLWSAVARPLAVLKSMSTGKQMSDLVKRGRADFDGLYVGRRFLRAVRDIDAPAALARSSAAVLIVHGTNDTIVPFSDSSIYLEAAASHLSCVHRLAVKGADHTFSSVVWRNIVLAATVKWFKETL